jgi:cytochrome c peroxidase
LSPLLRYLIISYVQVYNKIAELFDEAGDYDGEWPYSIYRIKEIDKAADGSYAPVILRLAWHASGTYDVETKTGGRYT